MKNFAVKFASDLSNEELMLKNIEGIPLEWPIEILELGDSTDLPVDGSPWILLNDNQLIAHKLKYQVDFDTWITSKKVEVSTTTIANKIRAAINFGNELVVSAATTNTLAGINQANKTQAFVLYCRNLTHFLVTGSLYAAIQEIDTMLADNSTEKQDLQPFLTNDSLIKYKHQIQDYLGIAKT